jgi:hypothetical protein
LQREADRAKVQSERQLVEKDKTIEKLLLYSEQMVDDFVTKILPKLNTVHKIECAPDKSRRDQLEIWLQSFRRDMLLLQ